MNHPQEDITPENEPPNRWNCDHPQPIDFRNATVIGQFCPLCAMHRMAYESREDGYGNWAAPVDPLLEDAEDESESLAHDLLELALDLDAWDGGDEEHNGGDGSRIIENIRRKLGLPNYFGDWILAQHERPSTLGVVARFLKEHADADSLQRGGGMFPDVSHVRKFLLEHGRVSWVEILPHAEEEYGTRHARKLTALVEQYYEETSI